MRKSSILIKDQNYEGLAEAFYQYVLQLGYNRGTSRARYNYARELLSWLESKSILEIEKVDAGLMKKYYKALKARLSKQNGKVLNDETIRSHLRVSRLLFTMLQSQGVIKVNPVSGIKIEVKRQSRARKILSQSEIKTLYESSESYQERAILSLAYGCGLRVSELVSLNIEDVRMREKILIVEKGKGNKRRIIPMSIGVVKDLKIYYKNERSKLSNGKSYKGSERAFMLHAQGGRMQKSTWNKYLKRIVERTENEELKDKEITIHTLRHTIATHLLESGMSLEQVRDFLGHHHIETTQIYTHIKNNLIK